MKKILLLTAGVIISSMSFAQKGTVLVGGNVEFKKDNNIQSLTSSSITNAKSHSIDLSPYVGYQFSKKLTAGAVFSYRSKKQESFEDVLLGAVTAKNEYKAKANNVLIGPFVRYTEKISDIFSVFGQLEAQYMSGKSEIFRKTYYMPNVYENTTEMKSNGMRARLFPALFINVKKNFGLNLSIGGIEYQKYGQKDSDKKPSSFSLSFGKTASIGISKNF